MPEAFCHLHAHSHFSLLEAHGTTEALLDRAAELEQPALALTDNGNLFGSARFQQQAQARGIRPLLGLDAYLAPKSHSSKTREYREGHKRSLYRMVLLAENEKGWANLVSLATKGYLDGFYYKPRIDRELIAQHSEGLIALSGGIGGEIPQSLLLDREDEAREAAEAYREIFGPDRFYLEVVDHGLADQAKVRAGIEAIAGSTGIPMVAANDVHYVTPSGWEAQDIALCIGSGRLESDPTRFRMSSREQWLKSEEEMMQRFAGAPELLARTLEIANRCEAPVVFGQRYLPAFTPPEGHTSDSYFRHLCEEGVRRKYGRLDGEILERLEYEMDIILSMGFVDYFLITWDFIRYARDEGIPVGPGRGSAAGSIVAYALDITQLDPIRYDLLFERFLNSERVSMPDIDIDFCKDRRSEVIQYVERKYGRDHVAQIITFGTMKARAVIRDVGRALDVPLPDVDRIAKKIPNGPKDTLEGAVASDEEVMALYKEDAATKRLFDLGLAMEGCARHASVHAAGVVITDRPLVERVPLYKNGDDITTQWPMDILEEVGLLKMDFLGLRTLTIIEEAVQNLERVTGERLDIDTIPLEDPAPYEMLAKGDSIGVFQLESDGMRDLLRRMRPDRFEDIVAVLALYRPGPLGSGMVDAYVRRKHGEEEITYPHPCLEPILSESLGVILYQEQVMRIANIMAGFSLNEADNLRKAMGKKKPEILAKFKVRFVEGAAEKDISEAVAGEVFDLIEYFAGYGFNKSHSAAYALVTYQTAYLKAKHPVAFMAGLLTCEMIAIEKTVDYTEECRRMGIEVLPPDVNASEERFTVDEGRVRFALTALRGVGQSAARNISEERIANGAFTSLFELCERIDLHKANKSTLEALIHGGALDKLPLNRAQKVAVMEEALAVGSAAQKDRASGQGSLFGAEEMGDEFLEAEAAKVPDLPELPEREKLKLEKEVLGFFLTGHPLEEHKSVIQRRATATVGKLAKMEAKTKVILGGMIETVRVVTIRNGKNAGKKMAILRYEDFTGSVEAVVFSDLYLELVDQLQADRICFLEGTVDHRNEEPNLRVERLIPLEEGAIRLAKRVALDIHEDEHLDVVLAALRRIVEQNPGGVPVMLAVQSPEHGRVVIQASDQLQVAATPECVGALRQVLGEERVHLN